MPGKRITDLQVNKYKELRIKHSQEAAAAKSGISVASARRVQTAATLPSQRPPRHWRTRTDPLAEVWDTEVVPMLEGAPSPANANPPAPAESMREGFLLAQLTTRVVGS